MVLAAHMLEERLVDDLNPTLFEKTKIYTNICELLAICQFTFYDLIITTGKFTILSIINAPWKGMKGGANYYSWIQIKYMQVSHIIVLNASQCICAHPNNMHSKLERSGGMPTGNDTKLQIP